MARFSDWVDLGKNTLSSLTPDEVAGLYSREWIETRNMLLADYRTEIDQDPRRLRRKVRSLSAMLFGLVQRLSPPRRVVFLFSFFWFFVCLFTAFGDSAHERFWVYAELAGTFVLMTVLLAMELIGKIKYRDELTLARDLQATLIPKTPPSTEHYEIAAFNHIANTVGGDIYQFTALPDGRLAVLFGDASGHGMAAGLVMAVAHASFLTQLEIDPAPAAIIASLNRILCRTGTNRSFFSCCYVLLSPDGSFSATFAGHPPALRVERSGKVVEHIGRGSYPLGIKPGLVWESIDGHLAPGERLVLHSDGLPEAHNKDGRDFGDAYIEAVLASSGYVPPQGVVDALVNEWRKFTVRVPAEDDVSIAVIARRHGGEARSEELAPPSF